MVRLRRYWIGLLLAATLSVPAAQAIAAGGWVARHAGQAPDVDSVCLLRADSPAVDAGSLVSVRCEAAEGYDLQVVPAST